MHPFHVQLVLALPLDDYAPRIAFAQWNFGKRAKDFLFPAKMGFFYKTSFTREGIFNTHNAHIWAEEIPHASHIVQHSLDFKSELWMVL